MNHVKTYYLYMAVGFWLAPFSWTELGHAHLNYVESKVAGSRLARVVWVRHVHAAKSNL